MRFFLYMLNCLSIVAISFIGIAHAAPDSKGTEFWLAFNANLGTPELSLFITSEVDTSGIVSIPGLSFSVDFTVTANTVTTVVVPSSAAITSSDTVESKGIHVTAVDEVTIYGLNRINATTDAYLGLPVDVLGTEYINLGWGNVNIVNATQFGIVAIADNTTVNITPTEPTNGHPAGVMYSVTMNAGEVYQLQNTDSAPADLTGSIISSDLPVSVYGSHKCANIPAGVTACDHVVEQLPPTTAWGQAFVTLPLATRIGGDTFRIMASQDNTDVMINGVTVATLNSAEFHEQLIDGTAIIEATGPVLVAQYSNGTNFDNVTSDPFMMLITPFEQFLGNYTVTTPASGFGTNFINVVAPDAVVGTLTLDGAPVDAGEFTAIGTSGFSGAQLAVDIGSHTLDASLPFGAFSYGFDSADSYGYPAGASFSPVAIVTNLTLTPSSANGIVGSEECLTARVTDQDNNPLEGIRVDYVISGVTEITSFAFTDVTGNALICYTGITLGVDTMVATVGALSSEASVTWGDTVIITPPRPIPAVSHLGLMLLSLLVGGVGVLRKKMQ